MPLTKVTPPNLHQTVKTMITTMVNETAVDSADVVTLINANAIDSADATLIINSNIAAKSTSDLSEGTNLYYTDSRADARITASNTDALSEGTTNLYFTDARVDARLSGGSVGNIVTTGYLAGPATFTIDPAAVGDNTGTVVIAGSLQVDGTTTTINSTTMTVDDLNLTLASGAVNAAAANGAGITVDGASATITYDGTNDEWDFNKNINVTGTVTSDGLTVDATESYINGRLRLESGANSQDLRFSDTSTTDQNAQFRLSSGSLLVQSQNNAFNAATTRASFANNGDISFYEDTGATPKMVWKASDERLGIGGAPAFPLDVSTNSSTTNDAVVVTRLSANTTGTAANNFGAALNFSAEDASGSLRDLATINGIYTNATNRSSALTFKTRSNLGALTTQMTIDSIGNVGIGTNSTTRRLDVVAAASSDCNIEFQTDKTDGLVQLLMSNDARQWNVRVNSDDTFAIRDNTAATERMRIDASGNVGIGTSLPTAGLHIDNPGNGAITAILDTDNTAVKIVFRNNTETGNNVQIGADGSSLVALTAATERMRIDASGNLLVGKTSSNVATAGHELLDYGRAIHTVNASTVQIINRLSNDGDITIFQKDGSTVGSIGTLSGFTYLGSGDTGMLFVSSDETIRPHNTTTNVARDNAISLGEATVRFKDAHFSGTVNAANFNTTSDATLKTNVETLSGSLDAVKSLRGVSFDWLDNGGSEIGVIAQEVEAVLPDVVSTNDEGIKSVKYGNMVAVLIEAIKEQQAQIDELKAQLNS